MQINDTVVDECENDITESDRFLVELEFIQNCSNPSYLNCKSSQSQLLYVYKRLLILSFGAESLLRGPKFY